MTLPRRRIPVAFLFLSALPLCAQGTPPPDDLRAGFGDESLLVFGEGAAAWDHLTYGCGRIGLVLSTPNFAVEALLHGSTDGKYSPAIANIPGGTFGNIYFLLEAGGMAASWEGLGFRAGRLPHADIIDSPYALFANGDALTANILEASYEGEHFFYFTRWIELNHRSSMETEAYPDGFPERGANLRVAGMRFGGMSFGVEDASVYEGRAFDAGYFLNPIPGYFVQYVTGTRGRPWATGDEDNNLLGFFWTWDRADGTSWQAQVLMDDFNIHALAPSTSHNPWKAAWSLGAGFPLSFGRLELYQAGATKFSFEPTYTLDGRAYGYSYYPDTVFIKDGKSVAIPFSSNQLGYRNGENNLAFLARLTGETAAIAWSGSLELSVSGSKSPANPWHETTWYDDLGTRILDEGRLETRIALDLGAARRFGPLLAFLELGTGWVFNELELVVPTPVAGAHADNDPKNLDIRLWKPSMTSRPLFSILLGGRIEARIP